MTTSSISSAAKQGGNMDDAIYAAFRSRVRARFTDNLEAHGALFTTDADLWPAYIESFPDGPERQHHTCTACRHFLRAYGGLATIGEHGEVSSAVWSAIDADPQHRAAVTAMAQVVRRAKITGVFLTSQPALGHATTGLWAHLALVMPHEKLYKATPLKTAGQATAEKREDHKNVMRALEEFRPELLAQVVDLLKSDALYRAEHVLGPAQWLLDLSRAVRLGDRANVVWRAVATAPAGFCHPRSSMVGTLLEDLTSGLPFTAAAERFRAKMHPLQYQRPQAAPSAGNIARAEEVVAKLGIARSLERRYARLDEVEKLWEPARGRRDDAKFIAPDDALSHAPVFGHLTPKDAPEIVPAPHAPTQAVTWAKFQRQLGNVVSMELLAPTRGNYCALLTAVHDDAPPILQWDSAERRNPVSWYVYNGGSDARTWSIGTGVSTWVKVTAITMQPSQWHGGAYPHHGESAIFLIDGCRDLRWNTVGAGLFPEILRADLREVRSTIEAHSGSAHPSGHEQASACGLRLQKDGGEVTVRVTSGSGAVFTYKIDRWE